MAEKGADKNGNGAEPISGPNTPKEHRLDFTDLLRAKKKPDLRAVMFVDPEEIGLDREEMGYGPNDRIGLVYHPLNDKDLPEILDIVKDFDDDEKQREYNDLIIMRCLESPRIPESAEGREILRTWLVGTRDTLANGIRTRSGLGLHEVKSAKEALGNLVASTPSIPSSSG